MGDGLGATPDPMLSALIGALSGTGGVDPLALLRTQLDGQAGQNPQAAQILRLLEQRRQQQDSEPQEEVILSPEDAAYPEHEAQAEQARKERARAARELRDTMKRLYAELEALRTRNDALAAAVGACYLCFGDDPLCEECGGRGVPGSLAPEPAAFRKYVHPALHRAQAAEAGRGRYAPPRDPGQTRETAEAAG
ncbi:MAG: hypothetical protein H0U97_01425 [Gammaproteobacteria bacterium]|nr:hypothetical protein [Gammaproteobacteria bacterium]